jgi:hypothetical protein
VQIGCPGQNTLLPQQMGNVSPYDLRSEALQPFVGRKCVKIPLSCPLLAIYIYIIAHQGIFIQCHRACRIPFLHTQKLKILIYRVLHSAAAFYIML